MKAKNIIFGLGIVAILLVSGCTQNVEHAETQLSFDTVGKYDGYVAIGHEERHVLNNQDQWQELWQRMFPRPFLEPDGSSHLAALPDVDFSKYTLIAVISEKPLLDITRVIETDSIKVFVSEKGNQGCAVVYPAQVIKIPKTEKKVEFIVEPTVEIERTEGCGLN